MISATGLALSAAALVLGAVTVSAPPGGPAPANPAATAAAAAAAAAAARQSVTAPGPRQGTSRIGAESARQHPEGGDDRTGLREGWAWPLAPAPRVLRPFQAPTSRFGRGHRGVDLAARAGQDVLAAGAGRVAHVGVIAGRGTVSVLHRSGIRTTYEPVSGSVAVGDVVAGGQRLGVLEPAASHCDPAVCLHFGALRGRVYLDPLVLLRGGGVRLLPLR